MRRLIEKGLMFGNLVHIAAPALVQRYNRALKKLTGLETKLTDFHVDISGYSPEIGDELGDDLYLNKAGVNRQFILLTTEQKFAPLLNAKFSTARGVLRQFIEENEVQLFALTARDVVAGELANSVYDISHPARLFDIRRIVVEADTLEGHSENAQRLVAKIERFQKEPDAWLDDVLIAEMIGLAKKTGDVRKNSFVLKRAEFEQKNFWTAHFGGLYLFREAEEPGVLSSGPLEAKLPIKGFDLSDRNRVAKFLEVNNLAEPIVKARGADAAEILQQKMDFVLADVLSGLGQDMVGASRRDLRNLARRHAEELPAEFHGLASLHRWVTSGGSWPRISAEHPAYFYALRARPTADRDLVNMLLAELSPLDFLQLFICHKELFYRIYAGWSDAKKEHVANVLEREYQADKAGTRLALFGDDGAWEAQDGAGGASEAMIDVVGPWGAVKRSRR